MDYTVPSIGREFGSVFLGDKNVALLVVSEGWAKVELEYLFPCEHVLQFVAFELLSINLKWLLQVREQGQQKAEASPFLAELQHLEEQAKQQGLGRWSKVRVRNFNTHCHIPEIHI